MVEVAQNDLKTLVLFAQQVFHGHLDIVKGNIGGTSGRRIGGLDGLCFHALAAFDEENA